MPESKTKSWSHSEGYLYVNDQGYGHGWRSFKLDLNFTSVPYFIFTLLVFVFCILVYASTYGGVFLDLSDISIMGVILVSFWLALLFFVSSVFITETGVSQIPIQLDKVNIQSKSAWRPHQQGMLIAYNVLFATLSCVAMIGLLGSSAWSYSAVDVETARTECKMGTTIDYKNCIIWVAYENALKPILDGAFIIVGLGILLFLILLQSHSLVYTLKDKDVKNLLVTLHAN